MCVFQVPGNAVRLRCAPYCFTKTLKPLVKKWRSESKRVLMYLDDGFGCDGSKQKN